MSEPVFKPVLEEKPTFEEITQRFQQKCAQAGDLQYRMEIMKQNLQAINQEIFQLNQQALELKKDPTPPEAPAPEVMQ